MHIVNTNLRNCRCLTVLRKKNDSMMTRSAVSRGFTTTVDRWKYLQSY